MHGADFDLRLLNRLDLGSPSAAFDTMTTGPQTAN